MVSDAPRPADRRAAVRYPCQLEAAYRLLADEAAVSWPATVRDLSLAGMRLEGHGPVEIGNMLTVRIQVESAAGGPDRLVLVRYAIAQEGGTWMIGCGLSRRLTEEELRALLGK